MLKGLNFIKEKGFVNSPILLAYDEEGQIYFLNYFLRTQNWKIDNNKINFPNIKTVERVNILINDYYLDIKLQQLKSQKDGIIIATQVGADSYIDKLNKQISSLSDKGHSFIDDKEKMRDFKDLTKEEFLQSYSYLREEDYQATLKELNRNKKRNHER